MDSFGVIFLISVGGYILFRIIRSSIKKEYRETIKRYRDEYPRAYREYFPKDTLYDWDLADMSFSDLSSRAALNEWALKSREQAIKNEEEKKRREEYERRQREEEERRKKAEAARQARLETERKQREIDEKYNRLVAKYPNGLRIYKREHSNTSAKERIITLSTTIFKDYEDRYQEHLSFVNWKKEQESFSTKVYGISKDAFPHWGRYFYEPSINGKSETGTDQVFKLKVWQFFCEGFCLSQKDIFQNYPSYKTQVPWVKEFLNSQRYFNPSVYDAVVSFIERIPEGAYVFLADSGIGDDWMSIDEYHFGYVKRALEAKGIKYYPHTQGFDCIGPDVKHLVVVELISNNDRLKSICSKLFSSNHNHNLNIVYLSLFKEYDEEEIIELNERKVREAKEAEEKRKREQEERERKEREEAERKAREEREAEERRKREEALRKVREEREYLQRVSHTMKPNAAAFRQHLTSNGVRYFYHFTDRRNLESIRRAGGLYSWRYCEDHNISIPYPGGDATSRSLDSRHGLSDYVRLSFCTDHPMKWVLEQKGYNMVLLKVKIDVACLEGTLFSDINATDNNHHHGGTLDDLRRINIPATQQNYVSRDSDIFKQHQAEVMVKTFIPLEYIEMPGMTQARPSYNDDLPF